MEELKKNMTNFQNIVLENRERLNITGIVDVFSFDDQIIIIETDLGLLTIKGENLKINKLSIDTSDFTVDGKIDSLTYSNSEINSKKNKNILSKIFKYAKTEIGHYIEDNENEKKKKANKYFSDLKEYLDNIRYFCLVMSENYIKNHFDNIKEYASAVESRLDDECCTIESVLEDNAKFLELAKKYNVKYLFIDDKYEIEIDL